MNKEQCKRVLDQFGALLMERVRDYGLRQLRKTMRGEMRSPYTAALGREVIAAQFTQEQQEVLEKMVTEAVDQTVHNFLWFIEEETGMKRLQLLANDPVSKEWLNLRPQANAYRESLIRPRVG